MDNGLRRVQGRKPPVEVLDVDLEGLARAVTSVMRRQATAEVIRISGLPYVQVNGRGVSATVPRHDWEKLLPLIKDGSLMTDNLPAEFAVRPLDSVVRLSSSTVDARDPLYPRVIGRLRQLFTAKVPT